MCNFSKVRYCDAMQCPKMLWLKKHKPELFDNSVFDENTIKHGKEVNNLARNLFGKCQEIPFDNTVIRSVNLKKMVETTKEYIDNGIVNICEASFIYNDCFCSVDILRNLGDNNVELYEVKSSSTGIGDAKKGKKNHSNYFDDVSYQVYVLTQLGYSVNRICLVHVNGEYVRGEKLDVAEYFTIEDVTDDVLANLSDVKTNLEYFRNYISSEKEPYMALGTHCDKPYKCGFFEHCKGEISENNVYDLQCGNGFSNKTKHTLFNDGLKTFADVRNNKLLGKRQIAQIECELTGNKIVDLENLRRFVYENIRYPLYFLDFETINPVIPIYEGTKPFQQIPTQYSLHIQYKKGGKLIHREFLKVTDGDPRRELAESLCENIPVNVTVVAYNKSFEQTRLRELAERFDDLREHLMAIHNNIIDLMIPFQKLYYYTSEMQGSYSIKYVLPALFPDDPELDYHNLEDVHNGSEASEAYLLLHSGTLSDVAKENLSRNMLKYCELDTLAMVKICDNILEITSA